MVGFCTFIMLVLLMFFFLFHVGVLLGFPLGNYTYNAHDGRNIDSKHKIISGIYLLGSIYLFLIYGQNGGLFEVGINSTFLRVSIIIACVFFVLDFFWSFASRSKKEKLLKTPILLIAIIVTVILLCQ